MSRRSALALAASLELVAMGDMNVADAQDRTSAQSMVRVSAKDHQRMDVPQAFVVCSGWHALCTASPDCKMNGDKAECACFGVNETHIVATSEIQDTRVKRQTFAECTDAHPCTVDQAPVCKAIASGQYRVDNLKYEWVSTYSYRGWCGLLKLGLRACDTSADGYAGDRYWAICDAAPCREATNSPDPKRPLICQCRVANEPFVGMNDSCTGENGGIMSSMPLWAWDFEHATYPFPMPGYEYVQGACARLTSDRWEESRRDREATGPEEEVTR